MKHHLNRAKGWASKISTMLDTVLGEDQFPVNVKNVAQEYSRNAYPKEPIIGILGDELPGFEGALYRRKKGWAIIYNNAIPSKGRINFTLGHEFGHYLIHRDQNPDGIQCSTKNLERWDSEYGQMEQEANTFAANLLMPFRDFRLQIPAKSTVDFDIFDHCTNRYQVSLIAAIMQWLEYTEKRAILVVSCDGYIDWARSSEAALKSGAYFKTSKGPIEIPSNSVPMNPDLLKDKRSSRFHSAGIWLPAEEVQEMTVVSERYDRAISLLILNDMAGFDWLDEEMNLESSERRFGVR